jgi:hypothetical protein
MGDIRPDHPVVRLVFAQGIQGFGNGFLGNIILLKNHQRPCPIKGFRDAGLFFQIQFPDFGHGLNHPGQQPFLDPGNLHPQDIFFRLNGRIIDIQMDAAPLQGILMSL